MLFCVVYIFCRTLTAEEIELENQRTMYTAAAVGGASSLATLAGVMAYMWKT